MQERDVAKWKVVSLMTICVLTAADYNMCAAVCDGVDWHLVFVMALVTQIAKSNSNIVLSRK